MNSVDVQMRNCEAVQSVVCMALAEQGATPPALTRPGDSSTRWRPGES